MYIQKMRIDYILWIISLVERLQILINWSVGSKNPQNTKMLAKDFNGENSSCNDDKKLRLLTFLTT